MRRLSLLALIATLLSGAAPAAAQQVAWEQWQHQVGIVDVGAYSRGGLVTMAAGRLYLVSTSTGAITSFSNGADGFSADPNADPYFAIAPPLAVDNTSCGWNADDLFILDLTSPPGIARVDPAGHSSRFANLPGVDTLGGI